MTVYDLPASSNWSKLVRDYGLVNLFCKMLVPGMAQNDLLLEIVMLVANIATDVQVPKYDTMQRLILLRNCTAGLQHLRLEHVDLNALSAVEGERRRRGTVAPADPLLPQVHTFLS